MKKIAFKLLSVFNSELRKIRIFRHQIAEQWREKFRRTSTLIDKKGRPKNSSGDGQIVLILLLMRFQE
jgi:hypothetical protein